MSGAEYAQQITEDCYGIDLPGFVEIDWQATWENLERYDYSEQTVSSSPATSDHLGNWHT